MKWIVEKGPAPEFRDLAKFWKEQIFSLLDLDGREIRSFLVMRSAQFKQLTKPTYYAEFPHDARRPVHWSRKLPQISCYPLFRELHI